MSHLLLVFLLLTLNRQMFPGGTVPNFMRVEFSMNFSKVINSILLAWGKTCWHCWLWTFINNWFIFFLFDSMRIFLVSSINLDPRIAWPKVTNFGTWWRRFSLTKCYRVKKVISSSFYTSRLIEKALTEILLNT